MNRPLVCPCGDTFHPTIFKDSIQLLCDPCVIAHYQGRADVAPCWISDVSVLPLVVTRPAVSVWPSARYRSEAEQSGLVSWGSARGAVAAKLSVPKAVAGPLSPGNRRG